MERFLYPSENSQSRGDVMRGREEDTLLVIIFALLIQLAIFAI